MVIEYDDVAACERVRESRSTLGGLFRRRERGVALRLTSGRRVTIARARGERGGGVRENRERDRESIRERKRRRRWRRRGRMRGGERAARRRRRRASAAR